MELRVHDSPDEVAAATATLVVDEINRSTGRFSLGLAGGSTPKQTYLDLRDQNVDWPRVDAWLADERWVTADSERNNGHMAMTTLFGATDATLHRPEWGPDMQPDDSAAAYERLLRRLHPTGPNLVLLGMGTDGHTASLFPGSKALDEERHWYVANQIPESGEDRLTATYPLLHSASLLIVLVVGEAKALALEKSLKGLTPAGRLSEGKAKVLWHVDRAAAHLVA